MARYLRLHQDHEIRLLEVITDVSTAPITCRMTVLPLLQHDVASTRTSQPATGHYNALSYIWKPADEDLKGDGIYDSEPFVSINGWACRIGPNLWNFLHEYRRRQLRIPIWIDSLCIDQGNIAERNRQVQMMGEIYRLAHKVIVWLGLTQTESIAAVKTLSEFGVGKSCSKMQLPMNNPQFQSALRILLKSKYWTRLWIIQELVLASSIEIWSGIMMIKEAVIHELQQEILMYPQLCLTAGYRILAQRVQYPTRKRSLLELLVENQAAECTVIHDRVYAMLSIASDRKMVQQLQVDYSQPLYYLLEQLLTLCEVSEADTLRFAAFLKRLLHVTTEQHVEAVTSYGAYSHRSPRKVASTKSLGLSRRRQNETLMAATGFCAGRLLATTPFPDDNQPDTSPLQPAINWGLATLDSSQDMIARPQELSTDVKALNRLRTAWRWVQELVRREIPESSDSVTNFARAKVRFSRVRVHKLRSANPAEQFATGVALGNVDVYDEVVRFSGFDLALAIQPAHQSNTFSPSDISGVLLLRPHVDETIQDSITRSCFQYQIFENSVEPIHPFRRFRVELTTSELIDLV